MSAALALTSSLPAQRGAVVQAKRRPVGNAPGALGIVLHTDGSNRRVLWENGRISAVTPALAALYGIQGTGQVLAGVKPYGPDRSVEVLRDYAQGAFSDVLGRSTLRTS